MGETVFSFEKNFANYCGVKRAVSVSSGTTALHLALLACGIKAGDEVITVPNTFIATVEAISHVNAIPVFADVKNDSLNIDPQKIEEKISSKTKAIIPVHLYGQPAEMDEINEIAQKHDLKVIEDACQAHGSIYKNKKAGSLGDIACFSFYPAKNLGAFGEGGIIVSNNEELIEQVELLRAHGEKPKNFHSVVGFNYRLSSIQAAILNIKLKYLDEWNNSRRKAAKQYIDLLQDLNVSIVKELPFVKSNYHLFVIRVNNRDKVKAFLESKGIGCGLHYPTPIHLQKAFEYLNYSENSFPIAEKAAKEILSLPMFALIKEEEVIEVVESLKEALKCE
jgi:dTDP-4-amino-4,6-dideoxygalactose transaminase